MVAGRDHVPIQTRFETREALERGRYLRAELLVNLRRSAHRAGKVEQHARVLGLLGTTHLSFIPSEQPSVLELTSSPLVKLPCSPLRTIPAFDRYAAEWWQMVAELDVRLPASSQALWHVEDGWCGCCRDRGRCFAARLRGS